MPALHQGEPPFELGALRVGDTVGPPHVHSRRERRRREEAHRRGREKHDDGGRGERANAATLRTRQDDAERRDQRRENSMRIITGKLETLR